MCYFFFFFFFQAEDGIRDAQESRGLGDVYKRQEVVKSRPAKGIKSRPPPILAARLGEGAYLDLADKISDTRDHLVTGIVRCARQGESKPSWHHGGNAAAPYSALILSLIHI
eukprot:TRINITY_DN1048_c0_g1_i7.p2 TRINITY_DN1048_c0_g1~~TRINITY_DN1048_c0_g1_i7.p2  ORF type:complete len:112 (-),score=31.26 TRINITY_DN1048_c0_g1_i7:118-453(-)